MICNCRSPNPFRSCGSDLLNMICSFLSDEAAVKLLLTGKDIMDSDFHLKRRWLWQTAAADRELEFSWERYFHLQPRLQAFFAGLQLSPSNLCQGQQDARLTSLITILHLHWVHNCQQAKVNQVIQQNDWIKMTAIRAANTLVFAPPSAFLPWVNHTTLIFLCHFRFFEQLIEINLCRPSRNVMLKLMERISGGSRLKVLSLEQACLDDTVTALLSSFIQRSLTLIKLSLISCQLNDQRVGLLSQSIQKNSNLITLALTDNGFSNVGAQALAAAFKSHTSFGELDIAYNNIDEEGAWLLVEAYRNRCNSMRLKRKLSNSDSGAHETEDDDDTDYSPTGLQLHLRVLHITDSGRERLRYALEQISPLDSWSVHDELGP